MADESELSRFRQEWKAEVTARAQGKAPTSSNTAGASSSSTDRPRRPSKGHKRPSFSHGPTAPLVPVFETEDADLAPNQPFPTRRESHSGPRPARRPSVTGVPVSALEHYERAVQKEAEGSLGESLKLYRQAFRMDESVDKAYKDKHFPRPPAAGKGKEPAQQAAKREDAAVATDVTDLISSFAGLRIEAELQPSLIAGPEAGAEGGGKEVEGEEEVEEAKEEKFSLLARVPSEILLHILLDVAEDDVAAFVRLTQVCRALCYVVMTEDRIWRSVTHEAFARMPWDWICSVRGHPIIHETLGLGDAAASTISSLPPSTATSTPPSFFPEDDDDASDTDEPARVIPVDEAELPLYKTYRTMFRLRPRIRFNGVYISTCNYHRSGSHTGMGYSWNTPVHIVTYYRYLRFYPDGTVLSLLTTHEPADVVYSFSKHHITPAHLGGLPVGGSALSSWGVHVSHGRWRMDPAGRVDVEVEVPKLERYLFRMQLRIGAARKRGSVKLSWEGFWSWNKLTDDLATFEGRNDKPFWFSRVAFGKG